MKILKKAQIAGAVMLAVAGITANTVQADSLLAPLVVDDSTWDTYFALKLGGKKGGDQPLGTIHYTWIQKGTEWVHLMTDYVDLGSSHLDDDNVYYGKKACRMYDNWGVGTENDLAFQSVAARSGYPNDGREGWVGNVYSSNDGTIVNGYNNGASVAIPPKVVEGKTYNALGQGRFAGMAVIDYDPGVDYSGLGSKAPEGNFAGFAYVVNPTLNLMLDYKMLNNHHRAKSGDFSIQFISKHVVDLMWLPDNEHAWGTMPGNKIIDQYGVVGGGSLYRNNTTNWYAAVTGPDMTKHTDAQGHYNSIYGLQVVLSSNTFGGGNVVNERPDLKLEDSPTKGFAQAYDNDEHPLSGSPELKITCVGMFQRDQFLTEPQAEGANGGWARRSIIPLVDQFAGANTPKIATGAIIYRGDTFLPDNHDQDWAHVGIGAGLQMTFQIETSGHLNTHANHANRPY